MSTRIIAITGGIGSGKSIICNILHSLGHKIYDCDSNAKRLMDNNHTIKELISNNISPKAIDCNGNINRIILSEIVFNNSLKLKTLNSIVHDAIKTDIQEWIKINKDQNILIIETAILYQSGLDKIVNEVWEVYTHLETRISRVMFRNNMTREHVISRINSQKYSPVQKHHNTKTIINDDNKAIIPQIISLLNN